MGINVVKLTVNNYGGTVNIIPPDPKQDGPIQITNSPILHDTRTELAITDSNGCTKLLQKDIEPPAVQHAKITKLSDFEQEYTKLDAANSVGRGGKSLLLIAYSNAPIRQMG